MLLLLFAAAIGVVAVMLSVGLDVLLALPRPMLLSD